MKPSQIKEVLDLAKKLQNEGKKFVPLFTGDAGLGKSEVCQAWVKDQQVTNPEFGFIDLRLAYMEPQDFLGLPLEYTDSKNVTRTRYATPSVWPDNGQGLILLEEVNRGMLATMNGTMQLLTDGKVNDYVLPKGWIVAAAINPESAGYDVNNMDAALKNRFTEFRVDYDHKGFVKYMRSNNWSEEVISYVEGYWNYKSINEIADGEVYVSPRSWSKVNYIQESFNEGLISDDLFFQGITSALGSGVGKSYYAHVNDNKPILLKDILANKKKALKKLNDMSKEKMRTDNVKITVDSVVEAFKAGEIKTDLLLEVLSAIETEDLVYDGTFRAYEALQQNSDSTVKYESLKEWLDSSKKGTRVTEILRSIRDKRKAANAEAEVKKEQA